MTFFDQLKRSNADVWHSYTHHEFVEQMANGELPVDAFKYYLRQDYIFLIHFARAYALAVYKSDNLEDMKSATETLAALINVEMELHVSFCKDWGLSLADMEAEKEDPANMAYTRFVLEAGMSGDILDLMTALIPCVVGYAEIGRYLQQNAAADNSYQAWIDMYAGDEYQKVAKSATDQLERLAKGRLTEARFEKLSQLFDKAIRLEIDFWQMGLNAANN